MAVACAAAARRAACCAASPPSASWRVGPPCQTDGSAAFYFATAQRAGRASAFLGLDNMRRPAEPLKLHRALWPHRRCLP